MEREENYPTPQSPSPLWAIVIILSVLYLPQSWFFLMDYSWGAYRLSWLKLVPGLPVFIPVGFITHPHDGLMIVSTWLGTAIFGIDLFFASRKSTMKFTVYATLVLLLSTTSAFGAYVVFRA